SEGGRLAAVDERRARTQRKSPSAKEKRLVTMRGIVAIDGVRREEFQGVLPKSRDRPFCVWREALLQDVSTCEIVVQRQQNENRQPDKSRTREDPRQARAET